jgi:hypothetical protein
MFHDSDDDDEKNNGINYGSEDGGSGDGGSRDVPACVAWFEDGAGPAGTDVCAAAAAVGVEPRPPIMWNGPLRRGSASHCSSE